MSRTLIQALLALDPTERIALGQVLLNGTAPTHVPTHATTVPTPEPTTCGAPTAAGTPCTRKAEGDSCAQHEGRTHAEWVAHHAQVAEEREAKKAEYLARKAKRASKPKVDNHALSAWGKAQGLYGKADSPLDWASLKAAYGHLFIA